MKTKTNLLLFLVLILFTSCASKNNTPYTKINNNSDFNIGHNLKSQILSKNYAFTCIKTPKNNIVGSELIDPKLISNDTFSIPYNKEGAERIDHYTKYTTYNNLHFCSGYSQVAKR